MTIKPVPYLGVLCFLMPCFAMDQTALLFDAVRRHNLQELQNQIQIDHNTTYTDAHGQTLLHAAVINDDHAITRYLLQEYVPKNRQDNDGNSALHLAAQTGSFQMVQLLLEKRISIAIRNKIGQTAYTVAKNSGHERIRELLKAHNEVEKVEHIKSFYGLGPVSPEYKKTVDQMFKNYLKGTADTEEEPRHEFNKPGVPTNKKFLSTRTKAFCVTGGTLLLAVLLHELLMQTNMFKGFFDRHNHFFMPEKKLFCYVMQKITNAIKYIRPTGLTRTLVAQPT